MASCAIRAVAVDIELARMNVFMATTTIFRGRAETDILDSPPQVVRPVTVRAGHHAMGPEESKLCLRMVKFHDVFPCHEDVAAEANFFSPI